MSPDATPKQGLPQDLQAVHELFAADAIEPAGLQERIEERLWQDVLAAERNRGAKQQRRWWQPAPALARGGALAAAAAIVVVFLAFDNGRPGGPPASAASSDPLMVAARNVPQLDTEPAASVSPAAAPVVSSSTAVVLPSGEQVPAELIAAGPGQLSLNQLDQLPRDESLLLGMLRAATASTVEAVDDDFMPFRIAASYIGDPRVPSSLRMAFIRMIGTMENIDVGDRVLDVFGRPGVAVARSDERSGLLQSYLLDEDDGRMLEYRDVVERSDDDNCAVGTVTSMLAFDSTGFPVDPSSAPYGAWPVVDPACAP
jgi:hypothetical protein